MIIRLFFILIFYFINIQCSASSYVGSMLATHMPYQMTQEALRVTNGSLTTGTGPINTRLPYYCIDHFLPLPNESAIATIDTNLCNYYYVVHWNCIGQNNRAKVKEARDRQAKNQPYERVYLEPEPQSTTNQQTTVSSESISTEKIKALDSKLTKILLLAGAATLAAGAYFLFNHLQSKPKPQR